MNLKKREWTDVFKNTVVISSIKSHYNNLDSLTSGVKKDMSQSINFDVIGNTKYYNIADSIGKKFYKSIKPSIIQDFDGGKAVLNESLFYYRSKELDSISGKYFEKYSKEKKKR